MSNVSEIAKKSESKDFVLYDIELKMKELKEQIDKLLHAITY